MGQAHTPGPWHVGRKFEVGPRGDADDQSSGMVIPVADVYGENREANARLIAAAPDLLKALETTRRSLISEFGPRRFEVNFPEIDAALSSARATGGTE